MRFIYDGCNIIQERDERTDALIAEYTYFQGNVFKQKRGTEERWFYNQPEGGYPNHVFGVDGAKTDSLDFTWFGEVGYHRGSTDIGFGWAGGWVFAQGTDMPFVLLSESNEIWLPKLAKTLNPLVRSAGTVDLPGSADLDIGGEACQNASPTRKPIIGGNGNIILPDSKCSTDLDPNNPDQSGRCDNQEDPDKPDNGEDDPLIPDDSVPSGEDNGVARRLDRIRRRTLINRSLNRRRYGCPDGCDVWMDPFWNMLTFNQHSDNCNYECCRVGNAPSDYNGGFWGPWPIPLVACINLSEQMNHECREFCIPLLGGASLPIDACVAYPPYVCCGPSRITFDEYIRANDDEDGTFVNRCLDFIMEVLGPLLPDIIEAPARRALTGCCYCLQLAVQRIVNSHCVVTRNLQCWQDSQGIWHCPVWDDMPRP